MALFTLPRKLLSTRLVLATAPLWAMLSHQADAWQAAPRAYYPPAYDARFIHPGYNRAPAYVPMRPLNHAPRPFPRYAPTAAYGYPAYFAPYPGATAATVQTEQDQPVAQQDERPKQNVHLKKQAFIDRLLPAIERENARLRQVRQRMVGLLRNLEHGLPVTQQDQAWVLRLAREYRVQQDPLEHPPARLELARKVDIIPASLTLAQAANESAWGKSRFATEANNLFGIWTYDASKGLVPKNRDAGKKHLVRKFAHIDESVAYNMRTLNSHPAYQELRELRDALRRRQQPIDGLTLAAGLEKYSAKGELYIKLIRDLIRQNQWATLDEAQPSA